ncbi:hypothetical protein TNIN_119221 [Trichonephila inaurata madagascariensis]|uniref:Uncharacterized protein n=1 Tax=Trichonephila inaurata madagascariensis TaxID=2747483 RepID=A0A8X6X932_9ARAC|nr:hypothetical protein TNIN_119221 [Trichonephila inaurata madagascariensis]
MPEPVIDIGYSFCWKIGNPNLLRVRDVNLQSIGANLLINDGHFSRFHLEFSRRPPQNFDLVCLVTYRSNRATCKANIECVVKWGRQVLSSLKRNDVEFTQTSNFEIPLTVPLDPAREPSPLLIECIIYPNIEQREDELRHASDYIRLHLQYLSNNMKDLLESVIVPNLKMVCREADYFYGVNSFILRKRWSKFFEIHEIIDTDLQYTVPTQISRKVLWAILLFVYSSRVEYSVLKFSPENSELARLVHFYDLLQLHTVYAPHQRIIKQFTSVSLVEEAREVRLRYETEINDVNRRRFLFTVGEGTNSRIIYFDIYEKCLGSLGRWLSYRISTNEGIRPIPFAVPEKFCSIFCRVMNLNYALKSFFCNGDSSNEIIGHTDINQTECDLRYDLLKKLSDDMGEMYAEGLHAHCRVLPGKTPRREEEKGYLAHQPILYTRLPYCQTDNTRRYVQLACYLPVEYKALPAILHYTYTGTMEVHALEEDVLQAIRECYENLGLNMLYSYVDEP